MPKLDLVNAKQIKGAFGEWLQAKGRGWEWTKPGPSVDQFPADIIAAGGPYVHFAVEDAGGATWTSRNGLPLTMDRFGTVSKSTVGGVQYLNCVSGGYDVVRDPWPNTSAFSLWSSTAGNRSAGKDYYIGSPAYTNNPSSLQFYSSGRVDSGSTTFRVDWDLPASTGPESVQWDRPTGAPSSSQLNSLKLYRNNVIRTPTVNSNRNTDPSGTVIVVGGTRNASGVSVAGGVQVRDILLCIGWEMNATQRAAMETYRQSRLSETAGGGVVPVALESGPERAAFSGSESIAMAGHSSLFEANTANAFTNNWSGTVYQNYLAGYTTSTILWDANGPERTQPAYDLLIVSELDDINGSGEYPAPSSSEGMAALQHLYWFALEATDRGADFVLFWHATVRDGRAAAFDTNRATMNYYRQWVEDKTRRPVWVVPADLYVRELIESGMPLADIYNPDGIHLDGANGGLAQRGVYYLFSAFLTGRLPAVRPGHEAVAAAALRALQGYRWSGLGGTGDDQVLDIVDPLPNPLPRDAEPGPIPASQRMLWTASGYEGPMLTGTQPMISGNVLTFPGTGLQSPDFSMPDGAYACFAMRWPNGASGDAAVMFMNTDAGNLFAEPYFSMDAVAGEMRPSRYNSSDVVVMNVGPISDDWHVFEIWNFGATIGGSMDGVDVSGTGTEPAGATTQLNLFSTGVAVEVAYLTIRDEMPDSQGRIDIRAAATAVMP